MIMRLVASSFHLKVMVIYIMSYKFVIFTTYRVNCL